MAWKYVFHSIDPPDDEEHVKTPFDEKRNKINLPKHFPEPITTFTESVRSELIGAQHNKSKQNLTSGEKEALDELDKLQKNGQIVLQPADKNGGICVMNRSDYINEAERQLKDTYVDSDNNTQHYYKKVDPKEVKTQFDEVKAVLDEGLKEGYIDQKMHNVRQSPPFDQIRVHG